MIWILVHRHQRCHNVGASGIFLRCWNLRPGGPGDAGRPGSEASQPYVSPTLQINTPHCLWDGWFPHSTILALHYQEMHVARRAKIVAISPFSLRYQGKTTNFGSLGKESGRRIYPGGNRLSHRTVSVGIMQVCCNDGRRGNMLLKQRPWSSR